VNVLFKIEEVSKMPRAENRKKPTNQSGGMKSGGFQNKQSNGGSGAGFGQAANKKQELIEKMKQKLEKKSE
jgi:N-acetylglucosamine-6-phosphate deacetylase